MKHKLIPLVLFLLCAISSAFGQSQNTSVKHFTLSNGLQVFINEDHTTPKVFGAIIVNAGGKNDPKDATGIAHYFEHMMFKGTDKIGTTDYEAEKVYLDQIAAKYDELALTTDEKERKIIQIEINELSIKAADYAIPNEVDKLIKKYGGTNVNAGTSFDQTIYFNTFPSSQIERWLEIYSERFRNPVFRLFQAELETVYEEKNRMADDMLQTLVFDVFLKNVYKQHPYGQQPLIGTVEHLKNPSISKMQEFFDTYYVTNNMMLLLVGNVDTEAIKPLIEEKFGSLRSGDVPKFEVPIEEPFNREIITVKATPIAVGVITFRSVPANHPDEILLQIANQLLTNGATGLLDKVVMNNDLMTAQPLPIGFFDYGVNAFLYVPKLIGQKFETAEKFIFDALDSLKAGNFDESQLDAIKLAKEKELLMQLENLDSRSQLIMQAISTNTPWEDVLNMPERIASVSKEDIMAIAQKYYGDENYLILRSRMGKISSEKIAKPDFKPIVPKNAEAKSDYAQQLELISEKILTPRFIDFENDLDILSLQDGVNLYVTPNTENQIFTLQINYRTSILTNPKAQYVAEYLNLIGAGDMPFNQYRRQLQALGAEITVNCDERAFSVKMTGYDKHFEESVKLLNLLLNQPKPDDKQLKKLVDGAKANYKFILGMPDMMGGEVMREFVLYGQNSKYLSGLSLKEVKRLTSAELLNELKNVMNYSTDILYCGTHSAENVKRAITQQSFFTAQSKPAETPYYREIIEYPESKVFVINDKKVVQSQINILANAQGGDLRQRAISNAFNEYFGVGMSSLVFQEIREFRSMAYGALARYVRNPYVFHDKPTYFYGWLQTQSDKTIDALTVMADLISNMPQKPERLDVIKQSLIQNIGTNAPTMRNLGNTVSSWRNNGYTEDPRRFQYEVYRQLTFDDIVSFYKTYIGSEPLIIHGYGNSNFTIVNRTRHPLVYSVYSDLKKIDKKALSTFGTIETIKTKNLIKK
ncbi:MAG: insulinase family protein [Bacteroidales bacterium]|jgi:predicted Zn-dependent peptidase|nr:insulinase family protein [Bacteroidales bacterium]